MTVMQTNDLINQLSTQLRPVQRAALLRRVLFSWLLGTAVAVLLLLLTVGVRPDLGSAMHTASFWMKWVYTGTLSAIGLTLCIQVARPDSRVAMSLAWLLVPIAVLLLIALYDWRQTSPALVRQLWMGHSALMCPFNITVVAAPVFMATVQALRKLAPTQLRMAGFTAGCLAGASGATVYALFCTESTAPFVLLWYTTGIVLSALLGARIGPRLLRW